MCRSIEFGLSRASSVRFRSPMGRFLAVAIGLVVAVTFAGCEGPTASTSVEEEQTAAKDSTQSVDKKGDQGSDQSELPSGRPIVPVDPINQTGNGRPDLSQPGNLAISFEVPKGDINNVVAYLKKMTAYQAALSENSNTSNFEQWRKTYQKTIDARLKASDQILASDDAESEARIEALRAKLDILGPEITDEVVANTTHLLANKTDHYERFQLIDLKLMVLGVLIDERKEDALAQIEKLCAQIEADIMFSKIEANDFGRRVARVEQLRKLPVVLISEERDDLFSLAKKHGEPILKEINDVLEKNDDRSLDLVVIRAKLEIMQVLAATGEKKHIVALRNYARTMLDFDDEGIAVAALQSVLASYIKDLMSETSSDPSPLIKEIRARLKRHDGADTEVDSNDLALALQIMEFLESLGYPDGAMELLEMIHVNFFEHSDKELAAAAKQAVEKVDKRLSLIGKPLIIEGMLLDGKPFKWEDYRGKVVLIDFWATWCPPCIRMMPGLKNTYAKYHDKGFEIVGISRDQDRIALEGFVKANSLPWPVINNVAGKTPGTEDPNFVRCSGDGIPLVILIDQRGNVVTIGLHGKRLEKRLDQLLSKSN